VGLLNSIQAVGHRAARGGKKKRPGDIGRITGEEGREKGGRGCACGLFPVLEGRRKETIKRCPFSFIEKEGERKKEEGRAFIF